MKKMVFLLIAAAAILPFAVSCEKSDKPTEEVVMEPAKTAEVAQIISFEDAPGENPIYLKDNVTYEILSIEFTDSGNYLLRRRPLITEAAARPATKSLVLPEIVWGHFDEVTGKLNCHGEFEGTVEPKENSADVTPQNSATQSANAAIQKSTNNNQSTTNAARSWSVKYCIIDVSVKGANISAGFNGCNFQEIAEFAASKGAEFDPDIVAGYVIDDIAFTSNSTLVFHFKNRQLYYGKYTLNGQDISYTLASGGNDFIGTTASGTLTFPEKNTAQLILISNVNGYTCKIEFNLIVK